MTNEMRLDELKAFIESQGWRWQSGKPISYGEQIAVMGAGVTALVNFWAKQGKMQVQGTDSPLKTALQAWIAGETESAPRNTSSTITGPHAGMDESGKGDWYGPLVVGVVYVDGKTEATLRGIGVRDSKALSQSAIQTLAGEIRRIVPPEHRHVWAIEPEIYNRLYAESNNVNLLLGDAYAQVAVKVWGATKTQTIVCDQFSQRADRLEAAFSSAGLPRPVQLHKAESASIAVAAASILASAEFTSRLLDLGHDAGLGEPLPKGASDTERLSEAGRRIISTHGKESLGHYAKLNFKPVNALLDQGAPAASVDAVNGLAHSGSPVSIRGEVWQVQYHPNGFWRYTFLDGGFLDWWGDSTKGTIYVHGKADAKSVQTLGPKTEGKTWHGEREAIDNAVDKHIARYTETTVASVLGIGWRQRETVLGARFDFTDGGVLCHYRGKGTLSIQGTPSSLSRAALEALPTPFWAGLDELTDTLKRLFPDWKMGNDERPGDNAEAERGAPAGVVQGWRALWPENKGPRQAANGQAPCQRAMVEDWASVLDHHQDKRHLLTHAPTGLGKTLAALVPALNWVAEVPEERQITYMVNRVAQHENPLRELREGLAARFETLTGQPLRVVDLVGRQLLCDDPQAGALPDSCRDARDTAHFGMLPNGVASWQEVKTHLTGQACPYHTLLGLIAQAHIVICDYWWLFAPLAQENSLMMQTSAPFRKRVLIVDEAHNLVPRVRAWMDVDDLSQRITAAVSQSPPSGQRCLKPVLARLNNAELDKGCAPSELLTIAGGSNIVQTALKHLTADAQTDATVASPERVLRMLLQPDETAVIYPTLDYRSGERRLVFRLLDPTAVLRTAYDQAHASVSMSGTLAAPADSEEELRYQVPLFGLPSRETMVRSYASPFPSRNQRWVYCPDTLGTYRDRSNHLAHYAEHIINTGQATPGVTAVFFNSYTFLETVRTSLPKTEQALIVAESQTTTQADMLSSDLKAYEDRLRQLVADHDRAYLFAVYQGKLAEGADFRDNLLKTIVCVSIPMEYPVLFHQQLESLYASRFTDIAEGLGDDSLTKAHEYALDRLSLSLVLQACGRGIRSEMDRCAFVLLDKRYHEYGWRRFLDPRPYNVRRPGVNVRGFHRERPAASVTVWDMALTRSAEVEGDS